MKKPIYDQLDRWQMRLDQRGVSKRLRGPMCNIGLARKRLCRDIYRILPKIFLTTLIIIILMEIVYLYYDY